MPAISRILACGACAVLAIGIGTQAKAASARTPAATTVRYETSMHIAGYDAAVAKAHGYRIITRDGVQTSVSDHPTGVQPDNTVGGPCGTSYIYLTGSILEFQYYTGFTTVLPSVAYSWDVSAVGPFTYVYNRGFAGALADKKSWRAPASGEIKVLVDDSGFYNGAVDPGSDALLNNGEVCVSAGPTSTTKVLPP